MVVTVQLEVAQSMAAAPGKMGLLSVGVQFYGLPRIVCTVPPEAFRPPPKVHSAVVRIDLYPKPAVDVSDEADFFALVRAGFAAPRKQLTNSLALGLRTQTSDVRDLLMEVGLESQRRPATLSLEEWAVLYEAHRQGGRA
jgi:16S rRNA (adenine1518-N6/adenine1519-N6)-dimethyltransferase